MACIVFSAPVRAADPIPGPADVDRVFPSQQQTAPIRPEAPVIEQTETAEAVTAPAIAKEYVLVLNGIEIERMTAFPAEEVRSLYADLIGQEITLDKVWDVANKITAYYREKGYFLSRAFVPAQEIDGGIVKIVAVEGYIAQIETEESLAANAVVQQILDEIRTQRPAHIVNLENSLLLLNDLGGVQVRAVISPLTEEESGDDRAVKLVLQKVSAPVKDFTVAYNNYGSLYLGPFQHMGTYEGSIVPLQSTKITMLLTRPISELFYGGLEHTIPLTPRLMLDIDASVTEAAPGYNLQPNLIESSSYNGSIGLTYKAIRQRTENLEYSILLDRRVSRTDILKTTKLTQDRITALRASVRYDTVDAWAGYNYVGGTYSRGLDILGAPPRDDLYISRPDVDPNFSKLEFYYARQQYLTPTWQGLLSLQAQRASGSMYSSEEFGYGGSDFGSAYDISEISGDWGGKIYTEVSWHGLPQWRTAKITPFAFYDIGKIYNYNNDQVTGLSASSAGLGLRIADMSGLSLNLSMAQPLSKEITTPIFGGSRSPRYLFQLSYKF